MNTFHRAFQIRAYPTQDQRQFFARTEGACRLVYQRSPDHIQASYEARKAGLVQRADAPIDFSRVVTQRKKPPETVRLSEVPSGPLGATLRAQDEAFKRFFKGIARYPKPHIRPWTCATCGETPDVMRMEGQIHLTSKRATLRVCQGPGAARTESLKLSNIMPIEAWKPRAE